MNTLISVSYCCDHGKGADGAAATRINPQEHAEWLEACVEHLIVTTPYPVIVSCTGFRGMTNIDNSPSNFERDVMWRVARRVKGIYGVPENPGHQVGAALCIRIGLEAASKLGYDCLIHTAEDVVPRGDTIEDMARRVEAGFHYVGRRWGPEQNDVNSQFFACWVPALVGPFDPPSAVTPWIERYLARLLDWNKCFFFPEDPYRTTHDHSQWCAWSAEEREKL